MKKNITIISSLFVLLIAVSACKPKNELEEKKAKVAKLRTEVGKLEAEISTLDEEIAKLDTGKKQEVTEISTMAIQPQVFKTYIDVQGRVDADENVSLSSQIPGLVTKINVQVGQQVSRGQVLAETDASAVYQQIADLQTNLDFATQVFQKQANLKKQNVGTEIQYLQAKTNMESLKTKMGALQEQLRMSKIISPINGTVDAVNIKIAQQVAPGMAAINVVNLSNLKIKADLAETYASRVNNGDEVLVTFPDSKDSLVSKVHYASRAINPLTRTFGVEVGLKDNKNYRPNMVAKIKINDYKSAKPVIVVPVKYIQKGASENYVLIAEKGKAVKKIITIGKEYNGMAQITEGLNEGDMLIVEGYDLINDGDNITVKNKISSK